jgi:hypothetical protein
VGGELTTYFSEKIRVPSKYHQWTYVCTFLLVSYHITTAGGCVMDSQIKEQVKENKEMIPGLMKRIKELEHNAVVSKDYNKYLDNKLDKVLEDRIVLRNENYKLKEKLNNQTRTQNNGSNEEECLACSA